MKLKALVAAVALVAAGAANAALTTDTGTGTSLVFAAWDTVSNQGYAINLGKTFDQLVPTTGSPISAQIAASDLATLLGSDTSGSALNWHVFAAKQGPSGVSNDGVFTTISTLPSSALDTFSIGNVETAINLHVTDIKSAFGSADSGLLPSTNAAYPGSLNAGTDYAGQLFGASAKVGFGSLNMYYINNNQSTLDYTQLSPFSLSNTGAITFGAPAAVPLPAAAWLFGSGVLGLVGIARRRFNAA